MKKSMGFIGLKRLALLATCLYSGGASSAWAQIADFDPYALEGRTFCSKKNHDFLDPYCISFVNGKALFTLKQSPLSLTIAQSTYEINSSYVDVAPIFGQHLWQFSYGSDSIFLAHRAGDFVERFENPVGSYWFTATQTHYLFVDAKTLSENTTIELGAGPENYADDCQPESQTLLVEAGSRRTHVITLACDRGYGTYLVGRGITNPNVGEIAFEYSTLSRHQLRCGDDIAGVCTPINQ